MPTKKPLSAAPIKKETVKKSSVRSKSSKSTPENPLVYASNEESFWVADGKVLNSLVALADALTEMEKATFSHHVTGEKNDFADWVDIVLKDNECAALLRKAKTSTSAKAVVLKSLKNYTI